ncbi:MAG: DUF6152 family protein [Candidatus Rariloculaceae bacterium]
MRTLWILLAGMTIVPGTSLLAHHSDAGYDQDTVRTFEGTVTRFVWRNPHITIYINVEDDNGDLAEWGLEIGSTPIMSRSGWTRDMLRPGDVISARAHPDRRQHSAHAMLITMETSDGQIWFQDESDYDGTEIAESIEGVWKGRTSTLGPFRQNLANAALTPAAEEARANYNYRVDSPIAQCIPPPTPGVLLATAVYLTEIDIQEGRVVIRNEFFDNERTIYTDGRVHPENGERTNQGHSIGTWEGDVLVVDTTLFSYHPSTSGEGVPGGDQKHVIERFQLAESGRRLEIDVWIEDPEFLAEPFSSSLQWDYTPALQLYRYNCDPELSGLE